MGDLSNRARGRWGEDLAVRHLERLGFTILDRNWRAPERELQGELDIVAADDERLVFCEVKARRRGGHGGAAGAVGSSKQHQIRRLAESWLRHHAPPAGLGVRFDVVTVADTTLRHWPAAF